MHANAVMCEKIMAGDSLEIIFVITKILHRICLKQRLIQKEFWNNQWKIGCDKSCSLQM